MKDELNNKSNILQFSSSALLVVCAILGLCIGYLDIPFIADICQVISTIFIKLLKLVSLPIIFFSLLATLSSFHNIQEIKYLGLKVLKYTLLTTIIAATVALLLYNFIQPASVVIDVASQNISNTAGENIGYWKYLLDSVPTNFIDPFVKYNVISVLMLAILISIGVLRLEDAPRISLSKLFSDLFKLIMEMTKFFLLSMPVIVFAFSVLFVQDMKQNSYFLNSLLKYLSCILAANCIQAVIVLPILLKLHKISPIKNFKAFFPAMVIAFFAKSSASALAATIDCAEKKAGINPKISRFSLPLCITINMNACAAFILITVLFISEINGVNFSVYSMISWIFIATIAAIGNAGVPMGCYMLASSFLAAMGVKLEVLVMFLPLYALVDMLESAINIWSDSCVTSIVNKKAQLD
jgi:Na+/H+-dicarboxylate symporter